jgi:hypothetical protein
LQAREPGLGSAQVVAYETAELKERLVDLSADDMGARIVATRVTAAVPVEARQRVVAARLQFTTEYVLGHGPI